VVVHGFGPPLDSPGPRAELVPWDAFWPPDGDVGCPDSADALALLDRWHRPPAAMVAWMRRLAHAAGAPAVLYQCEMSGGPPDHESALAVGEKEIVVVSHEEGADCAIVRRQWGRSAQLAAPDPLRFMLRTLGAAPTRWQFEPHARSEMPDALHRDAPVLDRLSLFRACVRGDVGVVDALLRRGADPHGYVWPWLFTACEQGHAGVVERLLHAGVEVKSGSLAYAANAACAWLLIEHGARVDDAPWALASVAASGFTDTVRFLLERGAAVDFVHDDHTLWFAVAKGGFTDLVERALAEGIDIELRRRGEFLNRSAVELAAGSGHRELVASLLAHGATLTASTIVGASRGGHAELLGDLLARGGDPDSREHGWTALHQAAYDGHLAAVTVLVQAGADPAAPSHRETALGAAAGMGHRAVVEYLLSVRPELVHGRDDRYPPLWSAVAHGDGDVIAVLLAHGADPQATRSGVTVADFAAGRGISLTGAGAGSAR
jgi:ankyrin repeat protein